MESSKQLLVCLSVAVFAIAPTACFGQGKTITVTGVGKASMRPDTALIYGTLSGTAKSADEALTKFQQAKRRLVEAVAKSKIESISVAGNGIAIQTAAAPTLQNGAVVAADAFGNAQPKPADARYVVKERMTLKLTGISQTADDKVFENILAVIGIAEDHGATMSTDPNAMMMMMFGARVQSEIPIATFLISDPTALQQKSYEAAVAAGAKRVKALTAITKKNVGDLIAIEEVSVGDVKGQNGPASMMGAIYGIEMQKSKDPDYSAKELGEIECEVVLKLTFAIAD